MAGKAKYVKLNVESDARSLAGYTIVGDSVITGGQRVLFLERPDVAPTNKKSKKQPIVAVPVEDAR